MNELLSNPADVPPWAFAGSRADCPPRAVPAVERVPFSVPVALSFAAGALSPFTVSLVGAMPVGELVLVFTLGNLLLWAAARKRWPGGLLRSPLLRVFLLCQALAFLGYVVADLYRGSSGNDLARGWARMVFLGVDLVAVAFLFGAPARTRGAMPVFVGFQWGYVLGMLWAATFGEALFGDFWKFGYAIPVTVAVLLLAPRFGGFWPTLGASFGLGVLHMVLDFRSLGAVCLLVPGVLMLQRLQPRARLVILPVWVLLGLAFVGYGYTKARTEDTAARGTRSDVERGAMLQAAWDGFQRSPVLGNGSWFSRSNVMGEFFAIRYERSIETGVGTFAEDEEGDGGMALHSQILVGLAEGGVLGGMFFFAYGLGLVWALWHLAMVRSWTALSAIQVFTLLVSLWSLGMSPFSGVHRVLIAMAAGLVLLLWRDRPAKAPRLRGNRHPHLRRRPDRRESRGDITMLFPVAT